MTLIGQVGSTFELQAAPSLDDPYPWYHLTTVTQTVNPQLHFELLDADRRFYRALPIPTNPAPALLAWIPPGTFTLGSPATEPGRKQDEQTHLVSISQGYWLGRHEVTQDEYRQVMLAAPSAFTDSSSQPVESVSWDEAVACCETLSRREQDAGHLPTGYVYRLPTEAEWEYAARSGSSTAYFFGDDPTNLTQYAWYQTNSGGTTQPVSTRSASTSGLSDLYGNVAEWCLDWYASLASDRVVDPQGPVNGTERVVRGGSWASLASDCRSASRSSRVPGGKSSDVGFRVALAKGVLPGPTNPNPARLVWIPPGTFVMGSPPGELDRRSDETQHVVTISQGLWFGRFEVTVGEYTDVTGIQIPGPTELPMVNATWTNAVQYCQLLTQREQDAGRLPAGYVYRLPTEAEWEHAARSGTTTRFFFGDDLDYVQLRNYAWSFMNASGQTHQVGQKLPSPDGLYDVYGNVWEWCLDRYGAYPSLPVVDPKGSATGANRVLRGGGFNDQAYCRSAARYSAAPNDSFAGRGFRVVLGRP